MGLQGAAELGGAPVTQRAEHDNRHPQHGSDAQPRQCLPIDLAGPTAEAQRRDDECGQADEHQGTVAACGGTPPRRQRQEAPDARSRDVRLRPAPGRRLHAGCMRQTRRTMADRFDTWSIRHPHTPVLRVLMRLPIFFWRLGLGRLIGSLEIRRGALVLLTATGRSSGEPRRTPVTAHALSGRTYLWCPYGDRSQWYRNVTANPIVTVQSRRGTQVMRAVPVDSDDEVVEIFAELRRFDETFLRSYLDEEGVADTPEDIAKNKERLHIRRLEVTELAGPPPLEADLAWLWLVPAVVATLYVMLRRQTGRRVQAAIAKAGVSESR